MQTVTTYSHAYGTGQSTLCAHHAERPPEHLPTLGAVSHGAHSGTCDACARLARESSGDTEPRWGES